MSFLTATLSQIGGRSRNDDACDFASSDGITCWVLADGAGGHTRGDVAAQLAVEQILNAFRNSPAVSSESVREYLDAAQRTVVQFQKEKPEFDGMRTTLVMLISNGKKAIWGHIGDSRLYRFCKGSIQFQTCDHSLVQLQVERGEIQPDEVRRSKDRNLLLEALGDPDKFRPDILEKPVKVRAGDAFLMCSDGLWDYVEEQEMAADLAKATSPKGWIERLEQRVMERADAKHDNYTAVAVFVEKTHRRLFYGFIGIAVLALVAFGSLSYYLLNKKKPQEPSTNQTGMVTNQSKELPRLLDALESAETEDRSIETSKSQTEMPVSKNELETDLTTPLDSIANKNPQMEKRAGPVIISPSVKPDSVMKTDLQ